MSPLDRKLMRDLWAVKGQALAIAAVIATGVLMLVMMTGLVRSLDETRRAYYERYRLADIFAPVSRAPRHLIEELSNISGVAVAEGRIVGEALIDIDSVSIPLRARAVSLPDHSRPHLNEVLLTDGREIDPYRPEEILLLKGFADSHGLKPGDRLRVTMNGFRRELRIVGLAQSPEFLYTTAPGEFISDDSRFGVIWIGQEAMEAAYDMEGAFNEAILTIGGAGSPKAAVFDSIDRILEDYGSNGAYGLDELVSHRIVSEEIGGLRTTSTVVPPLFLAVAAFLLYIVMARTIQAEREEIGLMKAFGYSGLEIGTHYLKFVVIIAASGALAGCAFGIIAGRAMIELYLAYFKLPFLVFQFTPGAIILGFVVSVVTAAAGSLVVLTRIFALTPATAMRPPTPPDFSQTARFGGAITNLLDQPSRMVLRRIVRQPVKMAGAVAGIACAMGLSSSTISILSSFDQMTELAFSVLDRSDLLVTYTNAQSDKAIFEIARMPGIIEVEPVRNVAAVLRHGVHNYRGAVSGLVDDTRLNRAMDNRTRQIAVRGDGIILSHGLADLLKAETGDRVTVEVREGRQPSFVVPVTAIAESLMGSPSYMSMAALNRLLGEPNRVSGSYLRIDSALADQIYSNIKAMPAVAGINRKDDTRAALQRMMDQGAGTQRFVMLAIAMVITFGVVYNAARIAQAERARDLASLRVIGFTRGETAFVLLGELAAVTLAALPLGAITGYFLNFAIAEGFSTDLYQISVVFSPSSYGAAAVAVLAAAALSGWLVKRDIDRTDLVAALKTRE